MSDEQKKPKIIVDDDWKERVQAEKAALNDEPEEPAPEATEPHEIPPASFPMLISSLATQALVGLGQIPDPMEGSPVVRPDLAKHHIDMLGVLADKTAGNLSAEEEKMLTDVLHDLRMMFVAVSGGQSPIIPDGGSS